MLRGATIEQRIYLIDEKDTGDELCRSCESSLDVLLCFAKPL
jgi:hypothetical protein